MNTTLTNATGTDLIILVQPDGSRILREVPEPKYPRDWNKMMLKFGAENAAAARSALELVYVGRGYSSCYRASDILEICGLEG